jgi:hypothetical protein
VTDLLCPRHRNIFSSSTTPWLTSLNLWQSRHEMSVEAEGVRVVVRTLTHSVLGQSSDDRPDPRGHFSRRFWHNRHTVIWILPSWLIRGNAAQIKTRDSLEWHLQQGLQRLYLSRSTALIMSRTVTSRSFFRHWCHSLISEKVASFDDGYFLFQWQDCFDLKLLSRKRRWLHNTLFHSLCSYFTSNFVFGSMRTV